MGAYCSNAEKLAMIYAATTDTRLSRTDADALTLLVYHLNRETGQCNPSIDVLRQQLGVRSKGTVMAAIYRLERHDYINVQRFRGRAGNHYEINLTLADFTMRARENAPEPRTRKRSTIGPKRQTIRPDGVVHEAPNKDPD